jgi:hypothetical protein
MWHFAGHLAGANIVAGCGQFGSGFFFLVGHGTSWIFYLEENTVTHSHARWTKGSADRANNWWGN